MNRYLACVSGIAMILAVTACGGSEEPAINVAAENELNASVPAGTTVEPAAPATAPVPPAAEQPAAKPASPKPAVPKPAAPKPAPAKPKPAEPAPDPHAGHDMNNMQH